MTGTTFTQNNVIGGSGGLTKAGGGTMILTQNNTYGGGTTISGGILQLGNGGTTGIIAGNVVNDGVLAFNRSDNITFAGDISGSGSVAYMGPGVVTLTGNSTYTGGTAITGGTVLAGSDSAFGAAGTGLTIVGGTVQATASFTMARPITLTTPGGTFDTNGNMLTVLGAISGTGGLIKQGAGTLELASVNVYTGATTVNAGTLALSRRRQHRGVERARAHGEWCDLRYLRCQRQPDHPGFRRCCRHVRRAGQQQPDGRHGQQHELRRQLLRCRRVDQAGQRHADARELRRL